MKACASPRPPWDLRPVPRFLRDGLAAPALAGIVLTAAPPWGAGPAPPTVRAIPTPPVPRLVPFGPAAGIDAGIITQAPAGIDPRFVVAAPRGLDEGIIRHPDRLFRPATPPARPGFPPLRGPGTRPFRAPR